MRPHLRRFPTSLLFLSLLVLVGALAEACHRRGVPLCLYFSTIDNDHPTYPHKGGDYEKPRPEEGDTADMSRYLDFVRDQVTELCTNYGKISGFWWDCQGTVRFAAVGGVEVVVLRVVVALLPPHRARRPDPADGGSTRRGRLCRGVLALGGF